MSTHYETVNVLGAPESARQSDYDHGYCEAIDACLPIAQDADAEIEELLDLVEEILDGNFSSLSNWSEEAKRTVNSIRIRRRA